LAFSLKSCFAQPRSNLLTGAMVAYFSMEIALEPDIPTYSGGLGVLAGDTLRSAADIGFSMIGITLLHRKGYFRQHLVDGQQIEEPNHWNLEERLERIPESTAVTVEGRRVIVRAWRYVISGVHRATVPVYLLDTDCPENSEFDRSLTDVLYGGNNRYRLCQEIVLGIGGFKLLHRLGYPLLNSYHMNEGHAALLSLALLEDLLVLFGPTDFRGVGTWTNNAGRDLTGIDFALDFNAPKLCRRR
jgi:starch phosphorylase